MADDATSSTPSGPSKTGQYPPTVTKTGLQQPIAPRRDFIEVAIERGYVSASKIEALKADLAARNVTPSPEEWPTVLVKNGLITQEQAKSCERGTRGSTVIAGFEILEKVGQGGMGAVFRARQVSMDRLVALKILPPKLAQDPLFKHRFLNEARVSAKLSHLNIINGIDCGEHSGYTFFAMEFVDGRTVKQIMKERGTLPPAEALGIVRQIVDGLIYARRMNLVHRDIKPDNIMLTTAGVAKLCDLGLAKQTESAEEASLTQAGLAVGTPHYISPEQARGDKNVDHRSDIYSLGATFYHMIVGKPLFEGPTSAVVMALHLTESAKNPCEINPTIPEGYGQIIAKMLAKATADRYATPEELAEDLDAVKAGGVAKAATFAARSSCNSSPTGRKGVRTTGPQRPVDNPTGRKTGGHSASGRKSSMMPVVALGAAVLAGVVGFMMTRDPKVKEGDKTAGAPSENPAVPVKKVEKPPEKSNPATQALPPKNTSNDVKPTPDPIPVNQTEVTPKPKGPPTSWWITLFNDRKQWRLWEQVDATTWREASPSDPEKFYKVLGRHDQDGKHGTLVRSPDGKVDVLIPDVGSDLALFIRIVGTPVWLPFGKINTTPLDVRTSPAVTAKAPVPAPEPEIKEVERPALNITSEMIYARFLQEMTTRAEKTDLTKLHPELKELAGKPEYKEAKADIQKELADMAAALQYEQGALLAMAAAKREIPLNEEKFTAKKGKVIEYSNGRLSVEVNKVIFPLPISALPPEDVVSFATDKSVLGKARYVTARGKHTAALALITDLPADEKARWERKLRLLVNGEKELVAKAFFDNMSAVAAKKSWKTLAAMLPDFEKDHLNSSVARENAELLKAWKVEATAALITAAAGSRLHTKSIKDAGDGFLEVSYDFTSAEQLKDFECSHGDLSVEDGQMVMPSGGGEYSHARFTAPIESLRAVNVTMGPSDGEVHRVRITFLPASKAASLRDPSLILRPGMRRILLEYMIGDGSIPITPEDLRKEHHYFGMADPNGEIKWAFDGNPIGTARLPKESEYIAFGSANGSLAVRKLTIIFKPTASWGKN